MSEKNNEELYIEFKNNISSLMDWLVLLSREYYSKAIFLNSIGKWDKKDEESLSEDLKNYILTSLFESKFSIEDIGFTNKSMIETKRIIFTLLYNSYQNPLYIFEENEKIEVKKLDFLQKNLFDTYIKDLLAYLD